MLLGWLFYLLLEEPFYHLYINCPSALGVGGWDGYSKSRICSIITSQPEKYWDLNEVNNYYCDQIIQQRFISVMITIKMILYFIFLFLCVRIGLRAIFGAFFDCIYKKKSTNESPVYFMIGQSYDTRD